MQESWITRKGESISPGSELSAYGRTTIMREGLLAAEGVSRCDDRDYLLLKTRVSAQNVRIDAAIAPVISEL